MFTIRLAGPEDVPGLKAIATAAYLPYVQRIGRAPAPLTADYRATVARGEAWLATDDAVPVGLIVLVPNPGYLLLENVAVIPSQQGRGIGTWLLRFADERARDHGLPEIRLYTNAAMTENISYYGRHGYTETHRAEHQGFSRVYFSRMVPDAQTG